MRAVGKSELISWRIAMRLLPAASQEAAARALCAPMLRFRLFEKQSRAMEMKFSPGFVVALLAVTMPGALQLGSRTLAGPFATAYEMRGLGED